MMMDRIRNNLSGIIALVLFISVVAFVIYWRTGVEDVPGDYYVKKGNYRLEDGQYEDAIKEFNLALQKNPQHHMAYLGLALSYMQMGKNKKALEYFNRTISLKPDLAVAYADRGILLDRMGEHEKALSDYKKALKLDPDLAKGPGWLWRFLRNIHERPPTIADRARYIEEQLKLPPEKRLLRVPEIDKQQRMYKK
ncbi:MAG TPA: tetratricopeptide repeat protein [Nitrospirae bacterium]|nr:tetratricopeptide repeat protein [Nitrospirota bacterium]